MATHVGVVTGDDNASGLSLATSSGIAVQAGDCIVVFSKWEDGSTTATISDNAAGSSNTYTNRSTVNHSNASLCTRMHTAIAKASETLTITQTLSVSRSFRRCWVLVGRPAGGTVFFYEGGVSAQGTSAAASSGALSIWGAGYSVAAFGEFAGATWTPGSGWTEAIDNNAMAEYRLPTGATSITGDGTPSGSMDWTAHAVHFREVTPNCPIMVTAVASAFNNVSSKSLIASVLNGDLLVLKGAATNAAQDVGGTPGSWTPSTTLGSTSAWSAGTRQTGSLGANAGQRPDAFVATATATADGSITAQLARTNDGSVPNFGGVLEVWRDWSSYVEFGGAGGVDSTAPNVSRTTTQANNAISWICTDWNAVDGASRTYRTSDAGAFTETEYTFLTGDYTNYCGFHPNAGAAGAKALGLTAPSTQRWALVGVDVLGTVGGGGGSFCGGATVRIVRQRGA